MPEASAHGERHRADTSTDATKEELPTKGVRGRVTEIDRFRGLAVILMVVANFIAGNRSIPTFLKHASDIGLTIVDLIAPLFVFAIGLTYCGSARRRSENDRGAAIRHVIVRYCALCGIGAIISAGEQLVGVSESLYIWGVLQALGVAGLLTLPVVFAPALIRVIYGFSLLIVYQLLLNTFWLETVLASSHGGLPATMAWGAMLVLATVYAELVEERQWRCVALAMLMLTVGILTTLIVPISKNRVSSSYVLVSLGVAGLVYSTFVLYGSLKRRGTTRGTRVGPRVGLLVWWGRNPLLLYLLHYLLLALVVLPGRPQWYENAPLWLLGVQGTFLLAALTAAAWLLHGRRRIVAL
jgi:predicted acyltransferase